MDTSEAGTGPVSGVAAAVPGDPSVLPTGELARILGTDIRTGLASAEARRRLRSHGANELPASPRPAAWRRFLAQFRDPLVYLLGVAIVVSLAAWALEGRQGWPLDALVIAAIVLANAILAFVQESRAEDAVAALSRLTPDA